MTNMMLQLDVTEFTPEQLAQLKAFVDSLRLDADSESKEIYETEDDPQLWREADLDGWTLEHVDYLRKRLQEKGKDVQLAAFDLAIRNGGFVSRESVYRLGDYGPDRRLNNWIAPFNSIYEELVEDRGLESETLPVAAVYDRAVSGYQRARGYRVFQGIVRLVREREDRLTQA